MNTVIEKSVPGNTIEQQYCHSVRNMSIAQVKQIEDLSDELLDQSEHMHLARELYKKAHGLKSVDFYF